jgi:hypothetical protein
MRVVEKGILELMQSVQLRGGNAENARKKDILRYAVKLTRRKPDHGDDTQQFLSLNLDTHFTLLPFNHSHMHLSITFTDAPESKITGILSPPTSMIKLEFFKPLFALDLGILQIHVPKETVNVLNSDRKSVITQKYPKCFEGIRKLNNYNIKPLDFTLINWKL